MNKDSKNSFDMIGGVSLRLDPDIEPGVGRRQAFRAVSIAVTARVHGALDSFGVNDISAGGICMTVPTVTYVKGEELIIDVLIAGRRFLSDLAAVVVRAVPDECACAFQNLTRAQELKLDKLVLEIQKRFIAQRKQEREVQNAHDAECPGPDQDSCGEPPTIHLPL